MQVTTVSTDELGDRSYLAHEDGVAVVVDPQRDVERFLAELDHLGLRCELVLETHIHNDYVTGGLELARRTGARYAVNAADEVAFERLGVRDGDRLTAGPLTVEVLATPGHTDTHLSYLVQGREGPAGVFTGGSLLYGSVGRTDLVDPERTEELTRLQFRSARRLASALDDATPVFPTHGFGSFCSSGSSSGADSSTIGTEKERNDALVEDSEDAFVKHLVAGLTAYPAYYAHMAPLNQAGPRDPDLSTPAPVDAAELRRRLEAGQWVIDLRDRTAYAADHLAGTVSIGLGKQFSTYVGWLVPWGDPITLLAPGPDEIRQAQLQLVRIGIDRLAGAASGTSAELAADRTSLRRASFSEVASAKNGGTDIVLDVRRDDERAKGGIPGSIHIPLHALLERLDELPPGRLWVHCASGYRAGIAASLLERAGREVIHVDDAYDQAVQNGLATG